MDKDKRINGSTYQCKNVASNHSAHNLSRFKLLEWINSLLDQTVQEIESLCSGAVYCQLMNTLFPGCVSLKKIKLEAKFEHEFITNLKQLQFAFRTVGCDKDVPINRLIKGRFQDNFEFLQWFRRFFVENFHHECSPQPIAITKQQDVMPEEVVRHAGHVASNAVSDLASLFECPVCFDYVLPPILQCQNGHLVCASCRHKVTCCPSCRDPIGNIRNLAMEKVASTVFFPCKYSQCGCKQLLCIQKKQIMKNYVIADSAGHSKQKQSQKDLKCEAESEDEDEGF